jgi:hypothetical protein
MEIDNSVAGRRLYQYQIFCDRLCMGAQGEAWHTRDEMAYWEGDVQRSETCALHYHLKEGA